MYVLFFEVNVMFQILVFKMGAVGAIKNYIENMIKESEPGYKIMLMDKETVSKRMKFL